MKQYLDHSREILSSDKSVYKPNRTGVDSVSLFGFQNEYDLGKGFPLVTTKKMPIRAVTHELIWFLRGDSNLRYLAENDVRIWDGNAFQHYLKRQGLESKFPMYSPEWQNAKEEYIQRVREDEDFAAKHGDMGPVYGKQWRHWKTSDGKEIDQIQNAVDLLRKSPMSRRIIVSAWNPEEVPNMALPPCHTIFHLNVANGNLDCQLYQRSCDMFLGVPFNIASYAILTQVLAQQADLKPGRFVHTFGDSHFYCGSHERSRFYQENLDKLKIYVRSAVSSGGFQSIKQWIENEAPNEREGKIGQDHVPAILEQLTREPKTLPKMKIRNKPFDKLTIDDFKLIGYESHGPIKGSMAV